MNHIAWSEAVEALDDEYGALGELMPSLTSEELLVPSACLGWTVGDLVFHMLLDAQRALVTFNSPSPGPPDRDHASYWEAFQASDDDAHAHARFVRLSASAHSDPTTIVRRWLETAAAAGRNARATENVEYVATQGHVLTTGDFIATLVVEATVHHLDLVENLEGRPGPSARGVTVTMGTIDALLRAPRPRRWDDLSYIRKATGRAPVDDEELPAELAARLPVFS